jgi:hypothetical protein
MSLAQSEVKYVHNQKRTYDKNERMRKVWTVIKIKATLLFPMAFTLLRFL